jgi:uncharacterized protein YjiK
MNYRRFLLLQLILCCLLSCRSRPSRDKQAESPDRGNTSAASSFRYVLDKPDRTWDLDDHLLEISGISWLNDHQLVAIEDLHPNLYVVQIDKQATISETIPFLPGEENKIDIEDVTMAGDTLYALWSHGIVYQITNWQQHPQVKEMPTNLSKENNTEGICYDPVTHTLLIACKNESGLDDEKKSARAVYSMNSTTGEVLPDPFLVIHTKDFKQMENEKIPFYPSAVAIHPITHDIYILSSKDTKCIAQYSHDGQLKEFQFIDKDLMLQPEGLCFASDGTLYVCSEGKHGHPAQLFQFNPVK